MSGRAGAVPLPPALPHPVTDSHCHLDTTREGDEPVPAGVALAAAAAVGVSRVVQVGCDLAGAAWAADLAEREAGVVAAVALHPTEATGLASAGRLDEALVRIEELARRPRVRAVGETGLDSYWVPEGSGRRAQEESFRAHLELARRLDRTLVIHDRDAHAEVLAVLDDAPLPDRVVFHCFSGDAAMARHCVARGWYLSFAGPVTFRNAHRLRAALAEVPLGQVLVETDAPYLAPHPYRGRTNAPALVAHTVRTVAEVLGRGLEEVCVAVQASTDAAFGGPWEQRSRTAGEPPTRGT